MEGKQMYQTADDGIAVYAGDLDYDGPVRVTGHITVTGSLSVNGVLSAKSGDILGPAELTSVSIERRLLAGSLLKTTGSVIVGSLICAGSAHIGMGHLIVDGSANITYNLVADTVKAKVLSVGGNIHASNVIADTVICGGEFKADSITAGTIVMAKGGVDCDSISCTQIIRDVDKCPV